MCYEVDGEAEVPESTRAAYSVEVGLGGLGEIKVDDDIDCLDVDSSRQEVWSSNGEEAMNECIRKASTKLMSLNNRVKVDIHTCSLSNNYYHY